MSRHCWQPIHIFHYLISCLHQCFTNIDFPSQISNERRPYSLRLFDHLSSLNLRNCKHENFSFRGHILNHYLNCRYLLYHHAYCAYLLLIFTWSALSFDRFSYFNGLQQLGFIKDIFPLDSYFATCLNIDSLNCLGVRFYLLWFLLLIIIITLGLSIGCNIDLAP